MNQEKKWQKVQEALHSSTTVEAYKYKEEKK